MDTLTAKFIVVCVFVTSVNAYCNRNEDCGNTTRVCCSITPALGRRQVDSDFMVHYCLPYKTESAPWCDLRMQYSPESVNYLGLCPCAPGLTCAPTTDLNPQYYPRDRYGKCTSKLHHGRS